MLAPQQMKPPRQACLSHVLAIVLCSLCGCVTTPEPQTQVGTFRGYYTKGSEVSVFSPCGRRELWWVTGHIEPLLAAVTSPRGLVGGTIYTEFTGELSPPGSFGHLGAYRRQVTVQDMAVARAPKPEDCKPAPR
jgi:hypothetical protein